ncbi:MAG: O-antigen ligase family protein [Patescibacteria group bacterium]
MQKYLKNIVYAGLFLIPFFPFLVSGSFFFPFITTKAFVWRILVEVVFAAWVLLALLAPQYRVRKSYILYGLLAFIAIIGLADIFGVAPLKSFWSNYERMEGFITLLHLGAFFVVVGSFFKEREWNWWWNTNLIASFLMVLYCFGQLLGLAAIHQGGVRVDGTLGNAAYLAVYLLFMTFIACMYAVRSKGNMMLRSIYSILVFLELLVLYFTATRGAILGVIGGFLLIALLNIRNKESASVRKWSIGTIVGIVILLGGFYLMRTASFVVNSPVLSRFSSITAKELKTEGRSFVWPMAIQGIKEKPILGWGQDNFSYVFSEHYNPKMYRLEPWFDRAHNIFLDWGVAGGILGLLAYLSLYVFFLYCVWKKARGVSYIEKSILTGLLAGYFFHNLFVFDHLVSYIMFISILAFIHALSVSETAGEIGVSEEKVLSYGVPVAVLLLGFFLYSWNFHPMSANASLIRALQDSQSEGGAMAASLTDFKSAYSTRLGRPETVEWISSSAESILGSNLTTQEKNDYYLFAKQAVEKQAADLSTDARYQMIAGIFFMKTGFSEDALKYLNRAKELIPGKQVVYFEIGQTLISKKDYQGALAAFKQAYEMAPEYGEAQHLYLVAAIYAGDNKLASELSSTIPEKDLVGDDRIAGALLATNRLSDLIIFLQTKVKDFPDSGQAYTSLAAAYLKAGNRAMALQTLRQMGDNIPAAKAQADQFIQGIQNGTIK